MSELQGRNWHIEQGFLDFEKARKADTQASILKSVHPDYVRGFKPPSKVGWGSARSTRERDGLMVLRVALRQMPDADRETFGDLIDVAHAVNRAADAMAGREREPAEEIFLNFYRPGASTGDHRDRETDTTVAVGLSGMANAYIRDPATGEWQPPIFLHPTDALFLDSTVPMDERPLHRVECTSVIPRIAVVNAAR